jgi:hypothetical protein
MTVRKWFLSICLLFLANYFAINILIPEIPFSKLVRTINDVRRQITIFNSTTPLSSIPDGFISLQNNLIRSNLQNPLFPGLSAQAALLSRKVEMCEPNAVIFSFSTEPLGHWAEESEIQFAKPSSVQ